MMNVIIRVLLAPKAPIEWKTKQRLFEIIEITTQSDVKCLSA
jgi:hypothetical protein